MIAERPYVVNPHIVAHQRAVTPRAVRMGGRNQHMFKRREINVVIIVSSLIPGACTLGPCTNGIGALLLGNRFATSTMTKALSTSWRILRLGPLGVDVDVIIFI